MGHSALTGAVNDMVRGQRGVGVQLAVCRGDEILLEMAAGEASEGHPMTPGTLNAIFSAGKALVATLCHMWAERGLIDVDRPLAEYWPEFGSNGKEAITPRHVLTHRSGVPEMPAEMTDERLDDWHWIVDQLAQATPSHPPGMMTVYHPVTYHYILGELLRRTDPGGRMWDVILAEELCGPLGIEELWARTPPELEPRISILAPSLRAPSTTYADSNFVPSSHRLAIDNYNSPTMHQRVRENIVTTASACARFWAMLGNGGSVGNVHILAEKRVRAAAARFRGRPAASGQYWSRGGYNTSEGEPMRSIFGPSTEVFGHTGGSYATVGWADLQHRIGVTIIQNRFMPGAESCIRVATELRRVVASVVTT